MTFMSLSFFADLLSAVPANIFVLPENEYLKSWKQTSIGNAVVLSIPPGGHNVSPPLAFHTLLQRLSRKLANGGTAAWLFIWADS
jgi:hypothetical protein